MTRPGKATWLGVFLALLGPLFVAGPPALLVGDPTSPAAIFVFLCGMWVLAIATGAIIVGPEQASLASIGLAGIGWRSVGIGLLTALAIVAAMLLVLAILGADTKSEIRRGKETLLDLPLWLRIFTVVTAGVTEEWLYRGYAITRLEWLTGRRWIAAAISLGIFALGHLPYWGGEAAIAVLIAGLTLTLVYLWTRDLVPAIVAHVAVDALSLLGPDLIDRI